MNRFLKGFIFFLTLFILLAMVKSITIAQVIYPLLEKYPPPPDISEISYASKLPVWRQILIDDFEYLDSPFNHGWIDSRYPVWGYGIGYTTIYNNVFDSQIGSRVIDCYRPPSVFLLSTPYEITKIFHNLITPISPPNFEGKPYIDMTTNPIISFDFKAPLGIDPTYEIFELGVIGEGNNEDKEVTVRIIPVQASSVDFLGPLNSTEEMHGMSAAVSDFNPAGQLEVTVIMGSRVIDGSWHAIQVNLGKAVKAAVDVFDDIDSNDKTDWYMARANCIALSGYTFRLDNIIFKSKTDSESKVDLFEMGPLYAQIFEPYRYLFIADYKGIGITAFDVHGQASEIDQITDLMLNPDNFLFVQDPDDPNDTVIRYWTDLGADPNLFGKVDPNISLLFDSDGDRQFIVDLSLPIFADPNLRLGGSAAETIINRGPLAWDSTIGGYSTNCIQPFLLQPLVVYPYDGMPSYIPANFSVIEVIKKYGSPCYSPELVYMLEGALWNAGVLAWQNIAALDFTPKYFEDYIVTIEVTDGIHHDVRTFPLSVVNNPVENYPPVLQLGNDDPVFFIGEINEYAVNLIDPDCFIFSLSLLAPGTTHIPGFPISEDFRTDMDDLLWEIEGVNGEIVHSYCFLPYCPCFSFPGMNDFDCWNFINTGLIKFSPQSEGTFNFYIIFSDARGGTGILDELKIICIFKSDADKDGIYDSLDNCPFSSNPGQMDSDEDGIGDACDTCPAIPDPNQDDMDNDSIGDLCDNCPETSNTGQLDTDLDGKGNACDLCPDDPDDDSDGDGQCGDIDNCPHIWNPDQEDTDGDGLGNTCDNCPESPNPDQKNSDGDGIGDTCDKCPYFSNPNQQDTDGDGTGDVCDTCPEIPDPDQDDQDGDGIGDLCDNCIGTPNPFQVDLDQDGIGYYCDLCPNDSDNDIDGDGICGNMDNCPNISNPDQVDSDGDNTGDACENSSSPSDKSQSKYIWPYYHFWPQSLGLLSFMPYSFPGYLPGFIYSSLFSNTQIPLILNIPQGKLIKTTNYGFYFLPSLWTTPYSQNWPAFIPSYEQNTLPIGFSQYLP
ncbi:MAG: thrombospondin type 3 repeat-containing protein [bacterium]